LQELPVETVWWLVLPLDGGGVLVPEPLAKFEREATTEDLMEAFKNSQFQTFQDFLNKFNGRQVGTRTKKCSKRKMKIILQNELYEPLAAEFQYEQVKLLKQILKEHGITGEKAKNVTGEFTFGLAMLIDQGEIAHEGVTYRPSITFTSDEEKHIAQPAEIDFHEYAFGTTEEVFDEVP